MRASASVLLLALFSWSSAPLQGSPPPPPEGATAPHARLAGTVIDGEGNAVVGATVSARALERSVTTDGDGRFVFADLAAAKYDLTIAAPGFMVERRSVALAAGERSELRPIVLTPGREVEGLVRDLRSREPVAGASIVALDPPGAVAATSDAEGAFSFGIGEEPLRLRVSAAAYPATELDFDAGHLAEGERLVIDLAPGGRIRVLVWGEETDAPCQGCAVNVQGAGGLPSLRTNGKGAALSELLAEGRYYVSPTAERSLGSVVEVHGGADGKWVDVVGGQTATVRFGEPAPVLQVRFRPPVPEGWSLSARTRSGNRVAERLPDGGFKVRKPAGGAVTLSLYGRDTVVHQAVLPKGDNRRSLDLDLPSAAVRGVLAVGGKPAAGRRLELASAADSSLRASALTAADGSFAIPFLPPGAYTLLVDGKPQRPVALAAGDARDLGLVDAAPR
jgi:carboxypeptidase family protein